MKGNIAFTLIELLVVVAIIAVLAAMLLPALANARAAAKRAACVSNLRQASLSVLSYATDNGEWLPISDANRNGYPYDLNGTNPPLASLMLPYVGNNPRAFFCPAAVGGVDAYIKAEFWAPYYSTTYIYYVGLMGGSNYWPSSPTRLTDPSTWFLFGDRTVVWATDLSVIQWLPGSGLFFDNHLNNQFAILGANWARMDGSVQWYPIGQLKLNNNGDPMGIGIRYYLPAELFP